MYAACHAYNPTTCASICVCVYPNLQVIDTTFPVSEGEAGLSAALARVAKESADAIKEGYSFIVLSDKAFSADRAPVSPLLMVGRVHHHLVSLKQRSRVGLIVESGEPREVHQFCTLVS